jgi:hypothetical protein
MLHETRHGHFAYKGLRCLLLLSLGVVGSFAHAQSAADPSFWSVDFQRDVFKTVLDKGLLAALILVAGFLLNKSIERLKSSLAWGAELLRQRMALATKLFGEIRELSDLHALNTGVRLVHGDVPQGQMHEFFAVLKRVEASLAECRLLFPISTVEAINKARGISVNWLTDWPAGKLGSMEEVGGEVVRTSPDASVQKWLEAERKLLNSAIDEARAAVQESFPSA